MLRTQLMHCLLISVFLSFFSCQRPSSQADAAIHWSDQRADGIIIPKKLLSNDKPISVRLIKPGVNSDVLGDVTDNGDHWFFEPIVPLTRGMHYEIASGDSKVAEIVVPLSDLPAPELLSIYPTQDTLPENVLKIYLKFSRPMEEGRSLSHVVLLSEKGDTMKGTFLDLQPELWNNDGTILTLWLDPGRVKRDLIPNKELGAPLAMNKKYKLLVMDSWRSKDGLALKGEKEKNFITIGRDDVSPVVAYWNLKLPRSDSKDPLGIDFNQPLDYSLINESFSIVDKVGNKMISEVNVMDEEKAIQLLPSRQWQAGEYTLQIETRLEDLAGNNLNRPFDRDLKKSSGKESNEKVVIRPFRID